MKVILGLDPGTVHLGWTVLRDGQYETSGTLPLLDRARHQLSFVFED